MRRSRVLSRARRRSLAVGAVVAVGWVVTGCTGGGDPGPSPSVDEPVVPTPSESPEPSPTETGPVKPERPAAMERDGAEGAAAAAEYFLELYPYVMATGDTTEWEAMSHAECGYCFGSLENAHWLVETRSAFTGGTTTTELLHSYSRDEGTGIYPVDLRSTQEAILVVDEAGEIVEQVDKDVLDARVEVGRNAGAWVIIEVVPLSEVGA